MLRPTALLAAVLLLVPACGAQDAGDVAPPSYARSVCSGLVSWRDGVTADSAALTRSLSAAADVPTVRARYTSFFAGAVRRTDQLLGTIHGAGAPKADHGLGYARDLTAAVQRTRAGLADARTRFGRLPAGDLSSYAAGARAVRDSLGTLFTQVGTTIDRLGSTYTDGDLNRAFRAEPACQRLGTA